jgi:transposase
VAGRRIHRRREGCRLGAEGALGWTAEIVRHPKKLAPEEVMRAWVREFDKEGVAIDLEKLVPEKGPRLFLPKRWIVERTFAWLAQNSNRLESQGVRV